MYVLDSCYIIEHIDSSYRLLFEKNIDAVIICISDGIIVMANPAACQLLGQTEYEICVAGCRGILDTTDPQLLPAIEELTLTGRVQAEINLVHKNGSMIPCEIISTGFIAENGQRYNNIIARKIPNQINYAELFQIAQERYSKVFNANPHMMVISTLQDGEFIEINDSFTRVLGYTREEAIGRSAVDMEIWVNPMARSEMVTQLRKNGYVQDMEVQFRTKSGQILIGTLSAQSIKVGCEEHMLKVFTDITQYKQLESEVMHLDRLNLVGQMAASMSHEIRNPMTTSRGFLQLLQHKLTDPHLNQYVELVINELDRANQIITDFLSVAKNKVVEKNLLNLDSILDNILPLIEANALLFNVILVVEKTGLPDLLLDENEIRQLVLNLCKNALEAMPNGGKLTIQTRLEKDQVVLSIRDTGKGIPVEFLGKIGTPFLTSKHTGTGLGLPICYRICSRHFAVMTFETNCTGTTFWVKFALPQPR